MQSVLDTTQDLTSPASPISSHFSIFWTWRVASAMISRKGPPEC